MFHLARKSRLNDNVTYLIVDEGGEGQEVEQVGEEAPNVGISVFSEALVVETVYLGDLPTLVVPAQDGDALAVSELERNKQGDSFYRIVSTIDVVPHEKIVCVWRVSTDAE